MGGNSKTSIIATVASDSESGETLSTLTFASMAKYIQNNAVINETASGSSVLLKELQRELQQVKTQLQQYQSSGVGSSNAERTIDGYGMKQILLFTS